jgi:hypothetical protein
MGGKKKERWLRCVPDMGLFVLKAAASTAYAGAGGIVPAGVGTRRPGRDRVHKAERQPGALGRARPQNVLRVPAGAGSPVVSSRRR